MRLPFTSRRSDATVSQANGPSEGAYEVVALREFWGFLSLVFFVGSLTTPYLARFLPPAVPGWGSLPLPPILASILVPVLSLFGLSCALVGGRKTTTTGRLGFFLNSIVLTITLALATLFSLLLMARS